MMIKKVDQNFIRESFTTKKTVKDYANAVEEIGLWKSEEIMIKKYFKLQDRILDIGCGAGRTTIGLYRLGYHLIEGVDLSTAMVTQAKRIAERLHFSVNFQVGDATFLDYNDDTFNIVIFSFNGIMQIPGSENRFKAFQEIKRVLKPRGYFLFTTHDREDEEYTSFWEGEKRRWALNLQDERLHEFGDLIIKTKDRETFLHLPTRGEMIVCLEEAGFYIIEGISRSSLCEESEEVKNFSTDCIFWIVQKPGLE